MQWIAECVTRLILPPSGKLTMSEDLFDCNN